MDAAGEPVWLTQAYTILVYAVLGQRWHRALLALHLLIPLAAFFSNSVRERKRVLVPLAQ